MYESLLLSVGFCLVQRFSCKLQESFAGFGQGAQSAGLSMSFNTLIYNIFIVKNALAWGLRIQG